MVSREQIRKFVDQIVERFAPEQIILFGSQAYGSPDPDSDVDLLVLMPLEGRGADKGTEILVELDPPFAVDLLVHTPEEVQKRAKGRDYFIREVLTLGRVMYDRRNHQVA